MANVELLDKVMDFIENHVELWDQGSWAKVLENGYSEADLVQMILEDPLDPPCRKAFCFAGHAVSMSGYKAQFAIAQEYRDGRWVDVPGHADNCVKDGETFSIEHKARELLDLSSNEAADLFAGGNTLEQLRQVVQNIKDGSYEYEDDEGYYCESCDEYHS